ncbi:MAG: hypothetical protein Q8N23_16185 [Archangium sp.]|nr:hypothetical protein [Archangium sp.]MDP3154216.1 hypothetical protein [Archangium sp.]MDP3575904.1 hypothetical protein [Archangium sp.]
MATVLVALGAGQASGFNYAEHKRIYKNAKLSLLPAERAALADLEALEFSVLMADLATPRNGFQIDDVPALVGDYTTDAANMLNRLFLSRSTGKARRQCTGEPGAELRSAERCEQRPESDVSTAPLGQNDWDKFIAQQRIWEGSIGLAIVEDFGLGSAAALNLFPLALKNLSHFSVKGCDATIDTPADRLERFFRVSTPTYNYGAGSAKVSNRVHVSVPFESAPAYYLLNHLGAMAFSALSKEKSVDEVTAKRARALAALLEQTALHHLSDLVAPGHQQCTKTNAKSNLVDSGGRKLSHSARNHGQLTALPCALCADPLLPLRVQQACASRGAIELRGDEEAYYLKAEGQADSLSGDVASALSRISLQEMLAATWPAGVDVDSFIDTLKRLDANSDRMCHLGDLLTQSDENKVALALWSEGWGIGYSSATSNFDEQLHFRIMKAFIATGAGKAYGWLPVYRCP